MSSSVNSRTSIIATLMENHFKELDLTPEQLQKVIAKLEKCFSEYFFPEKLGLQRNVPTDDDLNLNDGLPDSLFLNDLVRQVWMASNERFIKLVNRCLVEAEMENEARDYLEKARVDLASGVEIMPMKIWNLGTIQYQTFKKMGEMGFFKTSSSFEPPSLNDLFPTPAPGWEPNRSNNPGPFLPDLIESSVYDAGIGALVEDGNTSTPMEQTNPVEMLHIGEVTAQSVIGAAAEETQM